MYLFFISNQATLLVVQVSFFMLFMRSNFEDFEEC